MQKKPTLKSRLTKQLKRNYDLYLMILPAIVFLAVFCYYPMFGLQIAFKDYQYTEGIWGSPFIGFENFSRFFSSYYFGQLVSNTLILSVYTLIFGFPIPIIMALLLNQLKSKRFTRTVQTITYAPNFISLVIIVGMLVLFLNPRTGVVNMVRQSLGMESVNFMADPKNFRFIYVLSGIWQNSGFSMIVYLAALSGVDPNLYEAADIDGASRIQKLWHIDVPTIKPTVIILFILALGGIMDVGYEKTFLLQNELNLSVSEIIPTYVYKMGLICGDHGFATAVGLFNTVINFTLLVVSNRVSRAVSETSLW